MMPFLTSRGARLHYETLGSGPAVLLVHGITNHGLVWAGQIADIIGAGHQAILVDLAGHGMSDPAREKVSVSELAADMINLLDHLGTKRTIVCGLSLGGLVAQIMAIEHPSRVSGLILANTCADCTDPDTVAAIDSWIELFEQPDGPVRRMQAVWPMMLNEAFRVSPSGDAFFASWTRILKKVPGYSLANVARGLREFTSVTRLTEVRVPTLVISSELDRLFPPDMCRKVSDLIAGSRFVLIEGGGHLSSLDSPTAFNEYVLNFLTSQVRVVYA
jgi:3-oxoadipate enol-lactonase